MALTNKQAAAKLVCHELQRLSTEIAMTSKDVILQLAGRTRMTDDKIQEVIEYAKFFLEPLIERTKGLYSKAEEKIS